VAAFVREAPGVVAAESDHEGEFIHVYRGELADVDTPVRILALAPGIADEDVADAFTRVAGQWENASTHPNVVSMYTREETPRPWIAVERISERPLDVAQPTLSPGGVKTVVRDTAEAVRNAALYNTVHEVLRPDYIWVVADGDDVTTLVDDWGLRQGERTVIPAQFAFDRRLPPPVSSSRDRSLPPNCSKTLLSAIDKPTSTASVPSPTTP